MSRGRVDAPPQGPRRVVKTRTHHIGSGPPCPDGHGPMYDWGDGRWFCSSSEHGGNGKFYREVD